MQAAPLASVSAPVWALPVDARRAVAAALARPDLPAPLLPDDLAAHPLPGTVGGRDEVRAAIAGGLAAAVGDLGTWRLVEIVPALKVRSADLPPLELPTRLQGLLARNQVTTWSKAGRLTVEAVGGWKGAGARAVAELVDHAVAVGLALLPVEAPDPDVGRDRATVLDHGGLRTALAELAATAPAPGVRAAAGRLERGARRLPRRADRRGRRRARVRAARAGGRCRPPPARPRMNPWPPSRHSDKHGHFAHP